MSQVIQLSTITFDSPNNDARSNQLGLGGLAERSENTSIRSKTPSFSETLEKNRGVTERPTRPQRQAENDRQLKNNRSDERAAEVPERRTCAAEESAEVDNTQPKAAGQNQYSDRAEESEGSNDAVGDMHSGSTEDGSVLPKEGKVLPSGVVNNAESSVEFALTIPAAEPGISVELGKEVDGISQVLLPVEEPLVDGAQELSVDGATDPLYQAAIEPVVVKGVPQGTLQQGSTPGFSGTSAQSFATPADSEGVLKVGSVQTNLMQSHSNTNKSGESPGKNELASQSGLLNSFQSATKQSAMKVETRFNHVLLDLGDLAAVDKERLQGHTELRPALNDILARFQNIPMSYRSSPAGLVVSTAVPAQVFNPGWGNVLAERLIWFSASQVNNAQIDLDPPDLGPLQVRISSHGDQTSLSFTSPHVAVRDALDANLPRLKEMFDNAGLNLVDVGVSEHSHSSGFSQQSDEAGENTVSGEEQQDLNADVTKPLPELTASLHLVDYYA